MAELGYLQIIRSCNQSCRFCSNPENGRVLSLREIEGRLADFRQAGFAGVILTGGEPTLHPDLPLIVERAVALGLPPRLITNGQKTSDRRLLSLLAEKGLRHLYLSIHSHHARVQAELTGNRDSLRHAVTTLFHARALSLTVDIAQTICAQNAGHLDETIRFICERFPFVRHVSWTHLDPLQNRVALHPEVIPRLRDSRDALQRAFRYLHAQGRTFRIEKLPLCFLGPFAYASTETRKLAKGERLWIDFLDDRERVSPEAAFYGMSLECRSCRLNALCAGLWNIGGAYDPSELVPQTTDPERLIEAIRLNRPMEE